MERGRGPLDCLQMQSRAKEHRRKLPPTILAVSLRCGRPHDHGTATFQTEFSGASRHRTSQCRWPHAAGIFPDRGVGLPAVSCVCPASTAARCSIACLRCDSGQLSLQRRPPAHTTATGCCPEMLSRAPGALDSACSHECPSRNDAVAAAA